MVRQGLEDVGHFPLPNLDLTECFFDFISPLSFGNGFEFVLYLISQNVLSFSLISRFGQKRPFLLTLALAIASHDGMRKRHRLGLFQIERVEGPQ